MMRLCPFILALGLFPSVAWAQHARLAECVVQLAPDSVAMYYNTNYILTPQPCASLRRLTRLDANGNLQGLVLDYRLTDNSLQNRLHYKDGKLDGPVEEYHANGRRAALGQFLNGQRVGEWQYWYANGRPRQVLRFLLADQMRILTSWDSTGIAVVNNGVGHWSGTDADGNRYGGPIEFGLPHGQWESHRAGNNQLVQSVEFDRGHPRHTTLYYAYVDLLPQPEEGFDKTNGLMLGWTCDEAQRRAQFQAITRNLQLPTVASGTERYASMVTQRLVRYGTPEWYQQLPPYSTVRCALDTAGRFVDFISPQAALREVVRTVVKNMPAWRPATFKGRPVPSYIDITLNKETRRVRVRPAARLRNEDAVTTSAAARP
jgi:hypothetical protein